MKKLLSTVCASLLCLGNLVAQQSPATYSPDLNQLNQLTDSCDVNLRKPYTPLIGISCSYGNGGSRIAESYIQSILKAGGAPVMIPVINDGATLRAIVANLDGLVMTGGADVNPLWYNEEPRQQLQTVDPIRDQFDLKLIKLASDRNMPILGICRGEQLINVAFGGTLYQDIPSQVKGYIKHVQAITEEAPSHSVNITPGSQLETITGKSKLMTNSFHHQAVKEVAPGFRVAAMAKDSVIEAIEAWPNRPILGVQWHPEAMTQAGDPTMKKLFSFLVGKADTFHLAKEMHKRFLSVDTHTDTPLIFKRSGYNFSDRERNRVNLPKMEEGCLDGVFLAAFIWQGKRDDASLRTATEKVTKTLNDIHKMVEENKDLCDVALTPEDFVRLKKEGKRAIFIGIENGYGIGKDLQNIAKFKKMGVNYITLCHSYDNDISDSSTHTKNEWKGLSPFGAEVVKEMNRQGIMVDLSHANEKTFWDVIELTKVPFILSHSSARAICDHDRNLTDKQLKALAEHGGVIQLCLLNEYINKDAKKACLMDAIDHIDHIVKVAGIDHVGIGSDFDGGGGIIGCQGDNDFIQITVKLIERGYSEEDIAKIWGGNLLRVMTQVNEAASVK